MKKGRHELRARLEMDGERMSLDLWREHGKLVAEIEGENAGLVIVANTSRDIEKFLKKSAKFFRKAQE